MRIVTEAAADPGVYSATHFVYDKAQRVWLMFGESWEADGPDEGDCVDGYAITWAREFRYDATRARYLNRELDPEALEEGDLVALSEVWTDYDGDSSYGDFELDGNPPEPSDLRSYEPGLAMKDPWDESSGIEYYHADLIGTTRGTTDDLGAPAIGASGSPVTYTAFGERLDSDDHLRYGYAGSWGYQSHDVPNGDPVPYLHVGWRYYDPSTGRFLQRDPIGIAGGWNIYEYAGSRPLAGVDPEGLEFAECGGMRFCRKPPPGRPPWEGMDIMEEVNEEGNRKGWSDKYRHYIVTRRITTECALGPAYALHVGFAKEIWDNVKPPRDWNDSLIDMLYNTLGWLDGLRSFRDSK
ncbi:MAG: hypothetical protein AMXMBFR16_12980 [Candidatus Uhrbacteria bacterium]